MEAEEDDAAKKKAEVEKSLAAGKGLAAVPNVKKLRTSPETTEKTT